MPGLFLLLAAAAAAPAPCPAMEGVWAMGKGERIMVLEQEGCRLSGTVQEPERHRLDVRGFWTGSHWTMSATRIGSDGCGTTAWGAIRSAAPDRMLISVHGSDGLCRTDGETGPLSFDGTMTYVRLTPAPPAAR